MSKKRLFAAVLVTVLAALAVSSFSVFAQDTDDPTPPFGMMGHHGGMMGGMHGMMGGMMGSDDHTMLAGAAELLDMTVDELYDALHSGTSLQDLAKEKDVNVDNLTDAMLDGMKAHLAEAVEAGYITQEQADEHLAWMSENLTEMPMFNGTAGGMMGMMGHMHGGTGHGMGRWR
jgi:hypothetical protein